MLCKKFREIFQLVCYSHCFPRPLWYGSSSELLELHSFTAKVLAIVSYVQRLCLLLTLFVLLVGEGKRGVGLVGSCFRSYSMFIVSRVGFNSSSGVQATKHSDPEAIANKWLVTLRQARTSRQTDRQADGRTGRQAERQTASRADSAAAVRARALSCKLCINLISFGAPKSMQYECEVKTQTVCTHPTCVCLPACACVFECAIQWRFAFTIWVICYSNTLRIDYTLGMLPPIE